MKVFIFEGIATSGKSTLIRQLKDSLAHLRLSVVDEEETHIPIMNEVEDSHVDFFINLINQKIASNSELVIFDRLYLTQAFRSKIGIESYKQVEELLLLHNPLTIFLRVTDEAIADRVYKASQHREASWEDYIKTKGQTIEQIAEYYSNQQSNQLELLKSSIIPYKIFDTTSHKYQEITEEIVALATKS
jgi:thymidylate kinase